MKASALILVASSRRPGGHRRHRCARTRTGTRCRARADGNALRRVRGRVRVPVLGDRRAAARRRRRTGRRWRAYIHERFMSLENPSGGVHYSVNTRPLGIRGIGEATGEEFRVRDSVQFVGHEQDDGLVLSLSPGVQDGRHPNAPHVLDHCQGALPDSTRRNHQVAS